MKIYCNHTMGNRIPRCMESNLLSDEMTFLKQRGQKYLDLTICNPTKCGIDYPDQTILSSLTSVKLLTYEPESKGLYAAREAIAAYYNYQLGADDIVLTSSTSEAYSWLFKLLCDPEQELLVTSPSYPLFHWLAALEGIKIKFIPTIMHERWNIDLAYLTNLITPITKAIIIVNPNNPTGHFLSKDEWCELLSICSKCNITLLIDEVFKDYILEPQKTYFTSAIKGPTCDCPLFIISGLSKVVALPQIKLSWIAAVNKSARVMLSPLSFIADQYLSVSTSAQIATPTLLKLAPIIQAKIINRMRTNLTILDSLLNAHPHLSRLPVESGWSVIIRRPAINSSESFAIDMLKKYQLLIQPGCLFNLPGEGYFVVSLLTKSDDFQYGIKKLIAALA